MKVAKEASPAEQPPLPQAPVGGASPVPEGPTPDPNAGGEFDDGDEDMGGEMPPMGDPQGGEGMEQAPMGDDMGTQEGPSNDPQMQEFENIWNGLTPEQRDAALEYAKSMENQEQKPSQESMPPMGGEQAPMQEKVMFKKKQLEELMKRK